MLFTSLSLYILGYILAVISPVDPLVSDVVAGVGTLGIFAHLYATTKTSLVKTKMLCVVCAILNTLYIVCITSLYIYDTVALGVIATLISVVLSCIALRVVLISYKCGNTYNELGTFLAYKKPKNLFGYIAAVFYMYGSVRMIINGREFKFKDGVYVESEHVQSSLYTYRRINNAPIEKARSMLGVKWKWYRNCFTVRESIADGTTSTSNS